MYILYCICNRIASGRRISAAAVMYALQSAELFDIYFTIIFDIHPCSCSIRSDRVRSDRFRSPNRHPSAADAAARTAPVEQRKARSGRRAVVRIRFLRPQRVAEGILRCICDPQRP